MKWLCPRCGGADLQVIVSVLADLTQEDDGNFQTEVADADHEWDEYSWMRCRGCGHSEETRFFEAEDAPQSV